MARDRERSTEAVRITTAAASRQEDLRHRQRRYVWSMTIRAVCFVAAVLVGHGWLMWLLLVGAVFLPYVAVVMANVADSRSDEFTLHGADVHRRELPGHPEEEST